jgi:malonyl-CoA O-methyltransferase
MPGTAANAPIFLDPAPAYALWASSYPAHAHNPVMLAEERAMLALLPESLRGMAVLDAGCGSGRYMLHALRRGAARATGVDLSPEMLAHAGDALRGFGERNDGRDNGHNRGGNREASIGLVAGSLDALPVADASVDLAVCGLVVGHLPDLRACVAELARATRPGGNVLCSDVHPIGHALGWVRDFRHGGERYAVRHAQHLYADWHDACTAAGLHIEQVREPMLDPADIPAGARFDRAALDVPVALVLKLRRAP